MLSPYCRAVRRYVYWRLLSTDPEAAKDVVLAEKPVIADNSAALEPSLLQQLLSDLSTLASVRPLPPSLRAPQVYTALARFYCMCSAASDRCDPFSRK